MTPYLEKGVLFKATNLGPFWLQILFGVLAVEFFRYWIHRWQHEIPLLWRFHAFHHSVKTPYSLNGLFSYPLNFALRNVFPLMLTLIIGFSLEVLLVQGLFRVGAGLYAHCNVKTRNGWLNYVFPTNEVHRWNHSKELKESNNNYGTAFMIWDHVSGTFYFPKDRKSPSEFGLTTGQEFVGDNLWSLTTKPFVNNSTESGN
jgi:ornithine lipid hydroxylase